MSHWSRVAEWTPVNALGKPEAHEPDERCRLFTGIDLDTGKPIFIASHIYDAPTGTVLVEDDLRKALRDYFILH